MALWGRRPRGRAHDVRPLDEGDRDALLALLLDDPVANVFVASRVLQYGVAQWRLGCPIWGVFRDGELRSACHAGANLVPIHADDEALDAYAGLVGPTRRCGSILGEAEQAMGLYARLCERWGGAYARPRDVRAHQPVMTIDTPPAIAPDPRVRRIDRSLVEPYFEAAVKMYVEEVGASPTPGGDRSHYLAYVTRLIDDGHAYGIVGDDGRILYKSDVGASAMGVGQVQGVWLDPELRGRGLAAPAMAAVVDLVREEFPTVSLYVNDYNTRARATYRRIGMREVGEFATVLY